MTRESRRAELKPKEAASDQPVEKLELRPGDTELPFEQFANISVFESLSKKAEGKLKGKGGRQAVVLRHFKKDEVICRQGEPGWTAFYILKGADLLRLRESQLQRAQTADAFLAERDAALAQLDAAGKYARAEALEQTSGADVELIAHLRASADRPSDEDIRVLREDQRLHEEAAGADAALAGAHPELPELDPDAKRAQADTSYDPELSASLRASADGADLRAKAEVSLTIQRAAETAPPGGLAARLMRGVFRTAKKSARPKPRYIPIDGPVDLNYENPIAKLNEGELFGEMSCINYFPRSATVRATRDCYMLEMLRNVLEALLENEAFKAEMDAVYRKRVLGDHLRAIPLFANAGDEVLATLRDNVELVTKKPGEILFEEGEPSDSLYVIRIGTIKVFRKAAGGERVLAYRARGEVIGEIGIISGEPRMATCVAYEHPRGDKKARGGAQSAPAARVELVRLSQSLFNRICEMHPSFRSDVDNIMRARKAEDARREESAALHFAGVVDELGLMQGHKLMLIDLERCTRCDECVRACVDSHDDGVSRLFREGPRFGKYLVPSSCRQCLDPVCMIGCPVGSIHKGDRGEIIIEDWCIGCGICANQCPYDAITMHQPAGKIAVVCDQCASLGDGKPSCVYACPHDAALRVNAQEFFSKQLETSS